MAQIKPGHWLALIGLLVVLNVVVLAGLAVLLTGFVPWSAAGRDMLRAASPWITPRATLRPTFTPTATREVWPASAEARPAVATPWPSATPAPAADHVTRPAQAQEGQTHTALTAATPTRTRVPTRTPRAVSNSLSQVPPSDQGTGQVTQNASWQVLGQSACDTPGDREQCSRQTLPADRKVTLSWRPVAKSAAYRVYSDMGTGYGVYVFKAETGQAALSDMQLRADWRYDYRVQPVVRTANKQLVSLARSQWIAIMAITSHQPAGITRESDYAAIVLAN